MFVYLEQVEVDNGRVPILRSKEKEPSSQHVALMRNACPVVNYRNDYCIRQYLHKRIHLVRKMKKGGKVEK
jgi:hypothetical protein